jgi:hypothetical protein
MIPALIFWLIKQYRQADNTRQFFQIVFRKIHSLRFRLAGLALILLLLFMAVNVKAQTRELTYQIFHDLDDVGTIHFAETKKLDTIQLHMESQVKGRIFFISYSGSAKEDAVYRHGVLYHSYIYRKMNGKEKANKQHLAVNNQYIIQSGEKSEATNVYPITYNMLCLYSAEPVNITKVYSDNFQSFIEIKKLKEHQYKISFPDGTTNYYYYKDGVLVLVESKSTWYSALIILKT